MRHFLGVHHHGVVQRRVTRRNQNGRAGNIALCATLQLGREPAFQHHPGWQDAGEERYRHEREQCRAQRSAETPWKGSSQARLIVHVKNIRDKVCRRREHEANRSTFVPIGVD
jgi:hypothetical protein